MNNKVLQQLTVGVQGCARCGLDHTLVIFIAFDQPFVEDDGTVWAFWGTCPTTLAPILLRVNEESYEVEEGHA